MSDDSTVQIELALRGAQIAKVALELMNLPPILAHLQLVEIVKHVKEADEFLQSKGFK
jgi:hypothetical protein